MPTKAQLEEIIKELEEDLRIANSRLKGALILIKKLEKTFDLQNEKSWPKKCIKRPRED